MHFEVLSEDQSGAIMLEHLMTALVSDDCTFKIHSYRGIGRIPKKMGTNENASRRILLDQLPRLLQGYGNAFSAWSDDFPAALVVVCDLDNKDHASFMSDLQSVLDKCNPKPTTRFCLAVEEGEAWLLGDRQAIKAAFPAAKDSVLDSYEQDSVCGTWEKLADATIQGGSIELAKAGWMQIGQAKADWAQKIGPHMDIERNCSPSFHLFARSVRELL